jgi:hypothetical protein
MYLLMYLPMYLRVYLPMYVPVFHRPYGATQRPPPRWKSIAPVRGVTLNASDR